MFGNLDVIQLHVPICPWRWVWAKGKERQIQIIGFSFVNSWLPKVPVRRDSGIILHLPVLSPGYNFRCSCWSSSFSFICICIFTYGEEFAFYFGLELLFLFIFSVCGGWVGSGPIITFILWVNCFSGLNKLKKKQQQINPPNFQHSTIVEEIQHSPISERVNLVISTQGIAGLSEKT